MPASHLTSQTKAVGLVSGGLDSMLAIRMIQNLGCQVVGIFFCLPWGCDKLRHARAVAQHLKIPLRAEHLADDFIDMLRAPRFGRGAGLNPCVDCRIFMIKKAADYMRRIKADFVFTGEVVGQRPMSQLKKSLTLIDRHSGLNGRLLRPLSAGRLPPTIMETEGLIDRTALLDLAGRSRKKQYELAREWNAKGFAPPAGGCILTDRHFSRRLQDLFEHGYRNRQDLRLLTWGRHFRVDRQHKAVLGRDELENQRLIDHVTEGDHILDFTDHNGPTLILSGPHPSAKNLSLAAGLIQYHSRYRNNHPLAVTAIRTGYGPVPRNIIPDILPEERIEKMRI